MKKGIIITSFGTTYEDTLNRTIKPLEEEIEEKFSDFLIYRAFTSSIIVKRLKDKGINIKKPIEALESMKKQGIKNIYIQPSLIIEGHEYNKLLKEVEIFKEKNHDIDIKIGLPLLSEEKDYAKVINALNIQKLNEDEALVFMGHGTDHSIDKVYSRLENKFKKLGYKNIYVGTVEGENNLDYILETMDKGIKNIELRPFMLVAGDHAINDMASDEDDSWKSILLKEGYNVKANIVGLGELKEIREIFISYLDDII